MTERKFMATTANKAVPVTPDNDKRLDRTADVLFVGTGGTLVLAGEDGEDTVWKNIMSGTILPFNAAYVRADGTTADDILALYEA